MREAEEVLQGDPQKIINDLRATVREVIVPAPVLEVLVRMISALNPESKFASDNVKSYLRFGSGPRGAQATVLFAKVQALLAGRVNLSLDDLQAALLPCLRHRLVLNFQAEAEGITADDLIQEVLSAE